MDELKVVSSWVRFDMFHQNGFIALYLYRICNHGKVG